MRAAFAALLSIVSASLCCLPVGTFLFAAGSGGAAYLVPPSAQPWLMGLAALALLAGFWQTFTRKACSVRRTWLTRAMLSLSAVLVAAMWLVPQRVAGLLAGSSPAAAAADGIETLSGIEPFRTAFNAASGQTRLIVLLSPT